MSYTLHTPTRQNLEFLMHPLLSLLPLLPHPLPLRLLLPQLFLQPAPGVKDPLLALDLVQGGVDDVWLDPDLGQAAAQVRHQGVHVRRAEPEDLARAPGCSSSSSSNQSSIITICLSE